MTPYQLYQLGWVPDPKRGGWKWGGVSQKPPKKGSK
jgi:hypothetical protein